MSKQWCRAWAIICGGCALANIPGMLSDNWGLPLGAFIVCSSYAVFHFASYLEYRK